MGGHGIWVEESLPLANEGVEPIYPRSSRRDIKFYPYKGLKKPVWIPMSGGKLESNEGELIRGKAINLLSWMS